MLRVYNLSEALRLCCGLGFPWLACALVVWTILTAASVSIGLYFTQKYPSTQQPISKGCFRPDSQDVGSGVRKDDRCRDRHFGGGATAEATKLDAGNCLRVGAGPHGTAHLQRTSLYDAATYS